MIYYTIIYSANVVTSVYVDSATVGHIHSLSVLLTNSNTTATTLTSLRHLRPKISLNPKSMCQNGKAAGNV